jgi:peptidoglycan/xylan/chitin deacetylase (PgdA/CDA1 family)
MKAGLVVMAGLIFILSVCPGSHASNLPTSVITPTGCASGTFDIQIEATREWGVVPFRSTFVLTTSGSGDSVEAVYWTFSADDPLGAVGPRTSHVFAEPIDYQVTVRAVTAAHGIMTKQITISGHSAVMTLTFDDGHRTVLTDAVPLLESYCVTATAYIVPAWTSLDPETYMTWDDVALVQDAGWDIGSHGMTHHNLTEVDPSDLEYEVAQSQVELQSRGFAGKTFSLPNESYDNTVLNVVMQYYESCKTDRGINPGINDTDPYMIQSQLTLSWRPFEHYQAHIDSVLVTGGWYVLNNHVVREDCQGGNWCVRRDQLVEVIEYALANRVKIANIDEVMRSRTLGKAFGEDGREAGVPDQPVVELLSVPSRVSYSPADIRYYVSEPGNVGIGVYDVMGRRIKSLFYSAQDAGEHSVSWDGRNSSGSRVASGYYFVVFTREGDLEATARVMVLR